MVQKVILAGPRGFCAGVEMAIKALTWMVRVFRPPVYCYHEIVHNRSVVATFENAGVIFVDSMGEVPPGFPVMLSAHGSAPGVVEDAAAGASVMVDAVCPLVTKVHHEVRRMAERGFDIVYMGHHGHDEAVGTVAQAPGAVTLIDPEEGLGGFRPTDARKVALVAQTTLGLHEWEGALAEASQRYPDLWTARKSDLCYATTNRQSAVRLLAERAGLVLVVGSENSSNTRALVRVAAKNGRPAHRIDGPESIEPSWLQGVEVVGITAGASAPEQSVRAVIEALDPALGVEELTVTSEAEYFPPPPQLRAVIGALQGLVEGALTARRPGLTGPLDDDRAWDASRALDILAG